MICRNCHNGICLTISSENRVSEVSIVEEKERRKGGKHQKSQEKQDPVEKKEVRIETTDEEQWFCFLLKTKIPGNVTKCNAFQKRPVSILNEGKK